MKFSKSRPRLACYTASSGCGVCFSRYQLFVFSEKTESYTFGQQSKRKMKLLYEGKHRETKHNDCDNSIVRLGDLKWSQIHFVFSNLKQIIKFECKILLIPFTLLFNVCKAISKLRTRWKVLSM